MENSQGAEAHLQSMKFYDAACGAEVVEVKVADALIELAREEGRQEATKWNCVSEGLPEERRCVLLKVQGGLSEFDMGMCFYGRFYGHFCEDVTPYVTHWRYID